MPSLLRRGKFIIKIDHESLKFLLQQKLQTQLQKGMAKLMGLDYSVQYRKGKENVAADALSRCYEDENLAAITMVVLDWCKEVVDSYEGDEQVQELIQEMAVRPQGTGGYTLREGML